jgi:acetyl-CoA C-acetyltransferase
MMRKVYIIGGEQTDFSRNWKKENKNIVAMLREVMEDGLFAIGLEFEDIEKLNKDNKVAAFVGNFNGEQYIHQGHLNAFLTEVSSAFNGMPSARYEAACAAGSVALDAAMSKIENGVYDMAIVVGVELMKTVDSETASDFLGSATYYEKEAKGIKFSFPKLFGDLADATIRKYNLNIERYMDNLAEISCINYSNAKRNPLAQTRNWFIDKNEAISRGSPTNPLIGGRLAFSDCSQITDGAAMVVLISEAYAKEYSKAYNIHIDDIPYIKGWGHRVAPILFNDKIIESKESPYILKWTRQAIVDAYRRAGLSVNDIDFFETHDCFTSSEYVAISLLGITEPGQEYKAIESGIIDFNGEKPVNPSGGLIGCGHPVGASGVRMFLDLYKQISGKAGGYQIGHGSNGMMLNIGGSATTNYAFIVGK